MELEGPDKTSYGAQVVARLAEQRREAGSAHDPDAVAQAIVDRVLDLAVALEVDGEQALVLDGMVYDVTGPRALAAVRERFGAIRINVFAHDSALRGWTSGFALSSTQMRLDLSGQEPTDVELVRMSEDEFATYRVVSAQVYAEECAQAGRRLTRAPLEEFDELLPEGLATADQHLFVAQLNGERTGLLWFERDSQGVFVLDVVVGEQHRGRGLGRQTMVACHNHALTLGATRSRLSVFGFNDVARQLYASMGYVEVESLMVAE